MRLELHRKFLVMGLALALIFALCACGGKDKDAAPPDNELEKPNMEEPEQEETKPPTDKSGYLKSSEVVYRSVGNYTSEAELATLFGEPLEIWPADDFTTATYVYEDAYYGYSPRYNSDGSLSDKTRLAYIGVTAGEHEGIRGVKLGDSMESVMEKFPKEKDYKTEGIFFGEDTLDSQGGSVSGNEIILTSEEVEPFIKILIEDDRVKMITYYMFSF